MPVFSHKLLWFSLVEIILYVSIMSVFMLSMTTLLTMVFDIRERHGIITEVEDQGIQVMQRIEHILRETNVVTAPSLGQSWEMLSVLTQTGDVITLSRLDLILQYSKNTWVILPLTNDRVSVQALSFSQIGTSPQNTSIRIEMSLANRPKPGGRTQVHYLKTFATTVTITP